ncbi:GON-4-like protein [Dissostichus eleginoides]|uniref:GON-4-like protein n=1 Tax=Dissostichus eleginoides TaxID=100907 RepID=A0AAD9EW57_DISEL|nr:GON-4-like protein [Dissostichus eleginoides]
MNLVRKRLRLSPQLDQSLETKSKQHNLTTVNVRNIIHEVITNEHVVAMMKAAINDTEAVPAFEPKMTRAKFKEVVEKGVVIPAWNLSPIKKTSDANKAPQFVDIQLAEEDSSDEEYHPDEEEEDETAEDVRGSRLSRGEEESCSPWQVSRSRSRRLRAGPPMGPPPPPRAPPPKVTDSLFLEKLHAVEEELAVCLEPFQPLVVPESSGLMACRTRSKRTLRDVPLGRLEAELRAPDITPDMYDCSSAPEDREWTDWLRGLMTSDMENEEECDDEDDPEYNFLSEIDEPDVEDYQKEVNELMEELFETLSAQQRSRLQQQLTQHVQLLTQIHLLSSPVPVELELLAQRGELLLSAGRPSFCSVFRASNLQGALQLLQEVKTPATLLLQEKQPDARGKSLMRCFPVLPAELAWLFATRPVFLYPELLPCASLDPALYCPRRTAAFTAAEDCLLVLGLRNMEGSFDPPKLVSQFLLRKTLVQVRRRILQCCRPGAPDNIVKPCLGGLPAEQRPPVEREEERMPLWLMRSLPVLHPPIRDYNLHPGSAPEAPPPCLSGGRHMTYSFPPGTLYPPHLPKLFLFRRIGFVRPAPPPRHEAPPPSSPPASVGSPSVTMKPRPFLPPALRRLTLRHNEAPPPSSPLPPSLTLRHNEAPPPSSPPALRRLTLRHNEAPPPSSPPALRRLTLRHNEAPPPSSPPALRRLTLRYNEALPPSSSSSSTLSIGTRERIRRHYRTLCSLRDEAPPLPADTEQEVTSAKPRLQLQWCVCTVSSEAVGGVASAAQRLRCLPEPITGQSCGLPEVPPQIGAWPGRRLRPFQQVVSVLQGSSAPLPEDMEQISSLLGCHGDLHKEFWEFFKQLHGRAVETDSISQNPPLNGDRKRDERPEEAELEQLEEAESEQLEEAESEQLEEAESEQLEEAESEQLEEAESEQLEEVESEQLEEAESEELEEAEFEEAGSKQLEEAESERPEEAESEQTDGAKIMTLSDEKVIWTRLEDRSILTSCQQRGASRSTFSLISEQLEDKTPQQVSLRFDHLMNLFLSSSKTPDH